MNTQYSDISDVEECEEPPNVNNYIGSTSGSSTNTVSNSGDNNGGAQNHLPPIQTFIVDHLVKQPAEINQLQDIPTDLYYYCYYQQQERGQLLTNFDEQQQQKQQQQQRWYHHIFAL
jgi:hypothetical protein